MTGSVRKKGRMVFDRMTRFGLVALATDVTIEGDASLLMPPGTRLHVTRIGLGNPATEADLREAGPRLAEAMDLLVPGARLAGIGVGCTSAGAGLGSGMEAAARGRAPVTTPDDAALRAFAALGVRRVAVMAPYRADTTDLVVAHFTQGGLEVVRACSMGHADDHAMAMLGEAEIVEMALASDDPDAEAMFLSCTALPALELIETLEAELRKPVVTANQALFWAMLDRARIPAAGPGALFRTRSW